MDKLDIEMLNDRLDFINSVIKKKERLALDDKIKKHLKNLRSERTRIKNKLDK